MILKSENLCLSMKILCLEIFKIFIAQKNPIFKRSYKEENYICLRLPVNKCKPTNPEAPFCIYRNKNRVELFRKNHYIYDEYDEFQT